MKQANLVWPPLARTPAGTVEITLRERGVRWWGLLIEIEPTGSFDPKWGHWITKGVSKHLLREGDLIMTGWRDSRDNRFGKLLVVTPLGPVEMPLGAEKRLWLLDRGDRVREAFDRLLKGKRVIDKEIRRYLRDWSPIESIETQAETAKAIIRTGFRTLAKTYHPDVGGSAEQFRRVHETYQQLMAFIDGK